MTGKILSIQNKAKSLMWGCTRHSETEVLYAVGHKSYPKLNKYFIVSDDYVVSLVGDDDKKVFVKKCNSQVEVIKEVTTLLIEWFPAKGVQ